EPDVEQKPETRVDLDERALRDSLLRRRQRQRPHVRERLADRHRRELADGRLTDDYGACLRAKTLSAAITAWSIAEKSHVVFTHRLAGRVAIEPLEIRDHSFEAN